MKEKRRRDRNSRAQSEEKRKVAKGNQQGDKS